MSIRPALSEIISDSGIWHHVRPGFYVLSDTLTAPRTWEHEYTAADFAAICPQLVSIWEGFNDEIDHISSRSIALLIDFWAQKPLILPLSDPLDINSNCDFVECFSRFLDSAEHNCVHVIYSKYAMAANSRKQLFPCYSHMQEQSVAKSWLDEHYPEWRIFTALSESLDLDSSSLTDLVRKSLQPSLAQTGPLPHFN